MIVELVGNRLNAQEWGNKAARLSVAGALGCAVPPALCVQLATVAGGRYGEALAGWLSAHRPASVAVRTSSLTEDNLDRAHAGRTVTLLNCPPEVDTLTAVVDEQILPPLGQPVPSGCVMFQQQVPAAIGGVAFTCADRLVLEAADGSTTRITAGETPDWYVDLHTGSLSVTCLTDRAGVAARTVTVAVEATSRRLRQAFEFDLDVEWAWLAGAVFVLQVRPVTHRPAHEAT